MLKAHSNAKKYKLIEFVIINKNIYRISNMQIVNNIYKFNKFS